MKIPKITLYFAAMICILAWLDLKLCLSFLLSVLVHELGHLLVMKLWKIPVGDVVIGAGGAKIETGTMGHLAELCCAAAGPAAGVAFGLATARLLPQAAVVSVFLSLINLLPVHPMDGGRILRSILCMNMDEAKVSKITKTVASVVCCVLMICACWATIQLQMGIWPIFAALILLCRAGLGNNGCIFKQLRIK